MTLLTDNLLYDLFLVVTTLTVVIAAYYHNAFKYWERRKFPYLQPKFPMGNSIYLIVKSSDFCLDTVVYYKEIKKRGLKFAGIYTFTTPALVMADPDYIKDILSKDFNYFVNRGEYINEEHDPLSANLFALEMAKWKNMRTKLTPTFSSAKMKMMFETIIEVSKYMTDAIEKCAVEKKDIDILEFLSCFTTDVIGACAFGIECNSFKQPDAEFRTMGKKIFEETLPDTIRFVMVSKFPKLAKKLGVRAVQYEICKFFFDAVQNTINYREKNNITRPDFLQLLIDLKNKSKDTDNPFTLEQLVPQVFVFFLAGFDTSSTTMNFALYELCQDQDAQDRLRAEIFEVLEAHGGQLTYEGLSEMTYLQQVVDETLRLYTPVVNLVRVCVQDYKLRDTDLVIEKDTKIVIPLNAIHRDADYYPDPDKFDPDRFTSENKKSRHPFVYMPFGEGPRNCIGLRFGLMQSKIGLVSILSKFRVRISPKTDMPLRLDPTVVLMKSINKLYITAEKL